MSSSIVFPSTVTTGLIAHIREAVLLYASDKIIPDNAVPISLLINVLEKALANNHLLSPRDFSVAGDPYPDPPGYEGFDNYHPLVQDILRIIHARGVALSKMPASGDPFFALNETAKPPPLSKEPRDVVNFIEASTEVWDQAIRRVLRKFRFRTTDAEAVSDAIINEFSQVLQGLCDAFHAEHALKWLTIYGDQSLISAKASIVTKAQADASSEVPSPADASTDRLYEMQAEKEIKDLKVKPGELSIHNMYAAFAPGGDDIIPVRAHVRAILKLNTYMVDQVKARLGDWQRISEAALLRTTVKKAIYGVERTTVPYGLLSGLVDIKWSELSLSPLGAMEYLVQSVDAMEDVPDALRIFVVEKSFYQGLDANNSRSTLLKEIKRAVADNADIKKYESLEVAKWSDYAKVMKYEVRRVCLNDNRDLYALEPSRDELLILNPSAVQKRYKAPAPAASAPVASAPVAKRHYRPDTSNEARGEHRNDHRHDNRTDHSKGYQHSYHNLNGGQSAAPRANGTQNLHAQHTNSNSKGETPSPLQTVPAPSVSSSPLHKPDIKQYSRNFFIQTSPYVHTNTSTAFPGSARLPDRTMLPWRANNTSSELSPTDSDLARVALRLKEVREREADYPKELSQENLFDLEHENWGSFARTYSVKTEDRCISEEKGTHENKPQSPINSVNAGTSVLSNEHFRFPNKTEITNDLQDMDFVSTDDENNLLSQRDIDNRRSLPRWIGEVAGEGVTLAPDTQSTCSFISTDTLTRLSKICPDIKRLHATTHAISAHGSGVHPTVLIPITYEGKTINIITSVLTKLPEDLDILLGYSDILRFNGTIANSVDLLGKPYFPPDIEPNNIKAVEQWEGIEIPNYIRDSLALNANIPPSAYVTFPNSELKLEFINGQSNTVKSNHRHLPYDRASAATEIAKEWESYNWVDRISGRADSLCGVVLAPKPNGTFRLCVDTSELNRELCDVVTDIPEVADIVAGMAKKKYFSQLDMASAFMQLRLHPDSIGKICFKIGNEVYRLLRVPFGVKTVPGHFQAVIESMVRGIPNTLVYFDNIVIATDTLEEHFETLEQVISTFNKYNVRLNVDKSEILYKKIKVLGVIVSGEGVAADPDKVADISSIPMPKTKGQLHSFLGRVNYLAQFIPHLSTIIKPLTAEIGRLSQAPPRTSIMVTGEVTKAFTEVKLAVMNSIQKVFPDKDDLRVVFTDASDYGYAGVIALYGDKGWRIWQTVAGTWSGSEKHWATNKKELAAVHRTLMRFYHSLIGTRFILKSDHQALSHKLDMTHAPPIFSRWFEQISTLNFEVQYIRGEENVLADWLSRIQEPEEPSGAGSAQLDDLSDDGTLTEELIDVNVSTVSTFAIHSQLVPPTTSSASSITTSTSTDSSTAPPTHPPVRPRPNTTPHTLPGGDVINLPWFRKEGPNLHAVLSQAQRFHALAPIDPAAHNDSQAADGDSPLEMAPFLLGRVNTDHLRNYYRLTPSGEAGVPPHREEFLLDFDAIPAANEFPSEECIAALLEVVHIDTGHGGSKAMARRIQECKRQFPGYHDRIEEYLLSCPWCLRYKSPPRFELPPRANYADQPLDSIEIDIIDFSSFGNESRYGLVIVDINSGFTDIQPLVSKSAGHVCLALMAFMGRFGVPREIRSDQGKEFVNEVMLELTKLTRTNYNVSAPYYAQSHGRVERQNRTIRTIMNIFLQQMQPPPGMRNWTHVIPFVLMCINRTTNRKTQMSPFQLMFARRGYPYFTLPVPSSVDPSNTVSWAEHLALVSGPLRRTINDKVMLYNEKVRSEAEDGTVLEPVKKGDVVFRLGRLNDSKDVPAFFGPYIVHEVDNRNNAYLRTPLGTVIKTAHPRNTLKKARKALANEIMVPERIVSDAIAGDGSRVYCVQFVGYDSDANVWKSEVSVRNHPVFSEYLRRKGFQVG